MNADTVVQARIDRDTKERAAAALAAVGLSVSDVIRMLLLRIAAEQRVPFEMKEPNPASGKAINELEKGGGKRFDGADRLFDDLGI